MISFEEFAADLPLSRTEWFTSPAALEEALAEYGVLQPTRQASRFLDGVYFDSRPGANPGFRRVKAPTGDELTQLTHTIARRVILLHQCRRC